MKKYNTLKSQGKDLIIQNLPQNTSSKLNEYGMDVVMGNITGMGSNGDNNSTGTTSTSTGQNINVNTTDSSGGFFSTMVESFFQYKLYEKMFANKDKYAELSNQMEENVKNTMKSNPNHPWGNSVNADIKAFKKQGLNFKNARASARFVPGIKKLNYGFFGRVVLKSRILSPLLRISPILFANPWVGGAVTAGLLGLEIYYYLSRDEDKLPYDDISENGKFNPNNKQGRLIIESLAKTYKNATIIGSQAVADTLKNDEYIIGIKQSDNGKPSKGDILKLQDLITKISWRINEKSKTDELTKYYNVFDDIGKWESNVENFYKGKNLSGLKEPDNSNLYTHYINENDFDGTSNIYGIEIAEKTDWYDSFFGAIDAGMNTLGWSDWLASSNYLRNIKKINPIKKGDWIYKILLADYYLNLSKLDVIGRITEKTFLNLTNIAIDSNIDDAQYYNMLQIYKKEDVTGDNVPDYIETNDFNGGDFQSFLDAVTLNIQNKFVEKVKQNQSGVIHPVTKPLLALSCLIAVRDILISIYGTGQIAMESAYITSSVYNSIQKDGVSYEDAIKNDNIKKSPLSQKLDNGEIIDIMQMSNELLGGDLATIPG